jgi:hypothetical protein
VVNWYLNEEKKRKEQQEKNEISLLNRRLQQLLMEMKPQIDVEKYREQTKKIERKLVQSSIWNLRYLNNFENKEVVLEQGLLITHILNHETISNTRYLMDEVERVMRQLGNIDWVLYGEYNRRRKHHENR